MPEILISCPTRKLVLVAFIVTTPAFHDTELTLNETGVESAISAQEAFDCGKDTV